MNHVCSLFLDDDNGPFVFEPLSSWSVFTKVELKTRPVRVFERVGASCMLGDERDEVTIGMLFEVEDGGPSTGEIGAMSRPDRVLRGPSFSKSCG